MFNVIEIVSLIDVALCTCSEYFVSFQKDKKVQFFLFYIMSEGDTKVY